MFLGILVVIAGWTTRVVSSEEIAACPSRTFSANLTTTADMQNLADAMNRGGRGVFNVTLYGSVQILKRIDVSNQKIVHITGFGFPAIRAAGGGNSSIDDAGNTTGIFVVSGGSSLTVNAVALEGGYSEDGGAVAVLSSSSFHASGCAFRNNIAAIGGDTFFGHTKHVTQENNEFQYYHTPISTKPCRV